MANCYTPEPLSAKLKTYEANVYKQEGTFKAAATSISDSVNEALTKYQQSQSEIGSAAGSDPQGQCCIQCLDLVSQACSRLKQTMITDMGDICSKCEEVDGTIDEIKAKQQFVSGLTKSLWIEEVWDDIYGFIAGHWNNSHHGQAKQANEEIKQLIKCAETQLDQIASASYSISLGIDHGNMVHGGSMGGYTSFADNYSFNKQQWIDENPVVHLNVLQQAGCLVAGAVESVVKVVEGVGDAVLTVCAGVTSLITGNDDNWFRQAAEYDLAGKVGDGLSYVLTLGTVSADQYHESAGRAAGNFVGSAVAHGVLWATGLGIVSAVSIAGNSMEKHLQNGETVGGSLVSGLWDGTKAYVMGHAFSAIAGKIAPHLSNWANTSTSILARGYRAAATSFGAGWGSNSIGTKIVSLVASPVRGALKAYSHVVAGGADFLTRTVGATRVGSALINADRAVSGAFDKALDKGISAAKSVAEKGKAAFDKGKEAVGRTWDKVTGKASAEGVTGDGAIDVTEDPAAINRNLKATVDDLEANLRADGYLDGKPNDAKALTSDLDATVNDLEAHMRADGFLDDAPTTTKGSSSGTGKITAEESVFGKMTDEQFMAQQADAARKIIANPESSVAERAWAARTINNANNAGAFDKAMPTAETSQFASMTDEQFMAQQANAAEKIITNPESSVAEKAWAARTIAKAENAGVYTRGGATTNAIDAGAASGDARIGIPGTDAKMTYNEAQRNIARLTQDGFDPRYYDPTDPFEVEQAGLWHDSAATIANKMPGGETPTLRQNSNWYSNAENGANYYADQFMGGDDSAWEPFADNVYRVARIDGSSTSGTTTVTQPPVSPTVPTTPVGPTGPTTPVGPTGPTPTVPTTPIVTPTPTVTVTPTPPTVTTTGGGHDYYVNPGIVVAAYDEHVKNTRGQTEVQGS